MMKTMKYMLKRYLNKYFAILIAMIAAIAALCGCTAEDIDFPSAPAGEGSSLQLFISHAGIPTRAYSGEDFTNAEKYVKSVDLFFYPSDVTEDEEASYYVRTVPAMNEGELSNTGLLNVTIPNDVIETLFGQNPTGSHTFKVYAAVNCAETLGKNKITLKSLKNTMAVSESFVNQTLTDENGDLSDFDGFVMFTAGEDGDIVTFDADNNVINGVVTVNKLTSKIDLYVGFGENGGSADGFTVKDAEDKEWKVYNYQEVKDEDVFGDAVEAFIVNGVKKVRIGGAYSGNTFLGSGADGYLAVEDYFDLWYYDEGSGDDGDAASHMNYAQDFKRSNAADKAAYPYVIQAPFYTYPNEWTTDVLEQHRTYLILKVNWIPTANANVEADLLETYYKIPLNVSANNIRSNQYYRVKVKINTLGGEHFGEPVELTDCSYEILDWGTENIDAKLRETRYLEVTQSEVDGDGTVYNSIMYGNDQSTVAFQTSHKIKIKSISIDYYSFADYDEQPNQSNQDRNVLNPGNKKTQSSNNANDNDRIIIDNFLKPKEELIANKWQCIYVDDAKQTITLQHYIGRSKLNGTHYEPDLGKDDEEFKFTPYYITIEIEHEDEPTYNKTITFKHYPPIAMGGTVNTSFNLQGLVGGSLTKQVYEYDMYNESLTQMVFFGFVRVNDVTPIDNHKDRYEGNLFDNPWIQNARNIKNNAFGGLRGIQKGGIKDGTSDNPIMYVVQVTQLDNETKKYHLKDPRVKYSNTLLTNASMATDDHLQSGSGWVTGRHIDGEPRRSLTYYYPTNETMTEDDMYAISPKYRIASSFGNVDNTVNRETARKRCASYTEYGYPAGRWRLPTLGEIEFVTYLSKKGLIPPLFGGKFLFWNYDVTYWTANGAYKVNNNGDLELQSVTNASVRCIYDDWYWEKKIDGTPDHLLTTTEMYNNGDVFIWGDREKQNPQKPER